VGELFLGGEREKVASWVRLEMDEISVGGDFWVGRQ
jgi:hypothetical protein